MALRLSRLSAQVAIVDNRGMPTPLFLRYFNTLLDQVEMAVNSVTDAQASADAAQIAANDAQDQAITALAQAVSAAAAATAAQATANGKLTQAAANALYVLQDSTPTWALPAGTGDRSSFTAYTAPVISATPTQAEVQAVANAAATASQHLKALIADLIGANAVAG